MDEYEARSYIPPPVIAPVRVFDVRAGALVWLLFDPGTTIRLVAPGFRGSEAVPG
nr:hypothetical protein [uncultured Rhodopila sp.]